MNVLVTGGAGYLGSVLVPKLLAAGHNVRVLDILKYDQTSLISNFIDPSFEFMLADIRDRRSVERALGHIDIIVHLAGIAGDSACILHEAEALDTNINATLQLISASSGRPVVFPSSLRGFHVPSGASLIDESTAWLPKTIYAKTKHAAEEALKDYGNTVIFRMDTLFGLSPRMRLDLMVNDFVFKALHQEALVLFEANYKRFLCHITDAAKAIVASVEKHDILRGNVINLGSQELSFSKQDICLSIKEHVNFNLVVSNLTDIMGKENYSVSFEKARSLGFVPTVTLERGLNELVSGLSLLQSRLFYSNTPYY